jgi:hypothetical protein
MKDTQRTTADQFSARRKAARKQAVAAYAAEMAGTEFDLDPQLEAASLELLLARRRKKPKPAC